MKFTPFLLFLLLHLTVCSQTKSRQPVFTQGYKVAARFNFTGLADPFDNNVSAGAEWTINPHWSLVLDLAYIEHSKYLHSVKRTSGYMFRPAIRYYPSLDHEGFLEAVVMYKHVNYHIVDSLGRDCVNGIPTHQEYTSFLYGKSVTGINLQAGVQENLSRNHLLRLEAYIGLGLHFRNQDLVNEPNTCYNQYRHLAYTISGTSGYSVLPSAPAGLRLIYCIR